MEYQLNSFCRKIIDGKFLIFRKKRVGKNLGYIEINESGNEILSLMEQGVPYDKITPAIMDLYGLDLSYKEDVQQDVKEFFERLCGAGLVITDDSPTLSQLDTQQLDAAAFGNMQKLYAEKLSPFKFFVELTYACNLRCRHCYKTENVQKPIKEQSFLDKEHAFKLIDEIDRLGALEVYFTGGEMFLNPDAYEIIEYASKKNFLTILLTNGNYLNSEEKVKKLEGLDIYDVRISIYGDEGHHDLMTRRSGSYKLSVSALNNINKYLGIGTAVYVLTNENFECLDTTTRFFDDAGINYVINSYLTPTDEGDLFPLDFRISADQFKYLYDNYNLSLKGTSCSAGLSRFRITPYGEVNPCELIRDVSFGNIYNSSLEEIINGEARHKFVGWFQNMVSNHPCNQCEKQDYCTFCPGAFNLENGDYYTTSSYVCETAGIKMNCAKRRGL